MVLADAMRPTQTQHHGIQLLQVEEAFESALKVVETHIGGDRYTRLDEGSDDNCIVEISLFAAASAAARQFAVSGV